MTSQPEASPPPLELGIVVPVFLGEQTLDALVEEIVALAARGRTPGGTAFVLTELILVHDGARDRSDEVIQRLATKHPFIRPIWLSRNFGQHAATLAGMASSSAEWIATLDEDGQHDPADVARMLDHALSHHAPLVYASPSNPPPHGFARNILSHLAKRASHLIVGREFPRNAHSFRLVRGDLARSLAAYCGHGVYLDVALSWVASHAGAVPVTLRKERRASSGYSWAHLAVHFFRLTLTAGTRPLRIIFLLGLLVGGLGLAGGGAALVRSLGNGRAVELPLLLFSMLSLFTGILMCCIGIMAEYLGVTLIMAMGKPAYLILARPQRSPPPS